MERSRLAYGHATRSHQIQLLPTPYSLFPVPYLPTPDSRLPIPYLPITDYQ
ncbi:MAG: hypothetical protein F6J94_22220 [Moorea sp. SIO1F2]|uniref:hypothetical protein n=1 Tax=unclassified Moorena TaxID=2683338 RepID=UPI0013BCEAA5|nr:MULTISPECIES: hypothetical protein [unclassified Moorena]NEO13095.1 hypothetical protein [Moorena sp. SIO3E8]NEP98113.1 hypothetical protein [Moorena sp. SIO3F7]NET84535.1 hypothetical protein [Moorena sp. SIO1F2]